MSVFDQQSSNATGCFGFCFSSEEPNNDLKPNYDLLKQKQKHSQNNELTREVRKKKKEVDDMLSEAFNKLAFDERQRQQEVLHGVDDQIVDESTFINSALQELDNHLVRISKNRPSSAYRTAEEMDPSYVTARPFRTMFLRSNQYDTRAAADQMLLFFEVKQKLFGVEKLVKDITMEDLDEDDRASLGTGWLQLPGKDRSKRVICFQLAGRRAFKNLRNELRGKFYFMMSLLENEETQLRGVVHIIYAVGQFKDSTKGAGQLEHVQVSRAIPLYPAAIHFCCSDAREYAMCSLGVKIIPAELCTRIRIHYGSHLECQYRLSSFGISKLRIFDEMNLDQHMPTSLEGDETCRTSPSSMIIEPTENDVLYTGSKASENMGNRFLRNLVLECSQVYVSGSNGTKRVTVDGIMDKIHETGGRFLKLYHCNGAQPCWVESPMGEVRTKIAQMFRNQTRASKRVALRQKKAIDAIPIAGDPLPFDVIFGKAQNSRGKEFMQQLIKERCEEYDALDRGMKGTVSNGVMEAVKEKGGRFLQPAQDTDNSVYFEVSDDQARVRISKYFRNYRRTQKRYE